MKSIEIAVAVLFVATVVQGQQKSDFAINLGNKHTIKSSILGETRELLIYAPDNPTDLPLILVFDGGALFKTTVSAVQFMNNYSEIPQIPEAVVIGIQNTDRNRDMPIPQEYGHQSEYNFSKFIKDELVPWAKTKFKLNGHTIVVGHSQGGLFVSYLLATFHESFPWAIALDAPMNMDKKTQPIKEAISKSVRDAKNKIRYASIDAVFGWGDEWGKYLSPDNTVMSMKLQGESHESMAFKGVYEGLKFLYSDFAPKRKDLKLIELKVHYFETVSEKYGYQYEIPLNVLTASASRKIPENRKSEILDLLDYAEPRYGLNSLIKEIRNKALLIKGVPNAVVDSLLSLPLATPAQLKQYIGKWAGTCLWPEGNSMNHKLEIQVENGKPKITIWIDPNYPEQAVVVTISNKGQLVFARKQRGSGMDLTTAYIDVNGNLVYETWLVGVTIPEEAPEKLRNRLTLALSTPVRCSFARQ